MEKFEKKNLYEIYRKMSLDEVIKYYQELRKYEYEKNDPIKGIKIRQALYKLINLILKLDALDKKRKVTIIGDNRNIIDYYKEQKEEQLNCHIPKDKSRIYTCTHIGRFDIESALQAVGEGCYFIMADPGETYQNIDGLLLRVNGVSWFDMYNRFDAHTVNERQLKVLSQGGNELNFGEAAYCLDPVNPVGRIHPGVARRAIQTDSRIVPVSMEQYEDEKGIKDYVVNIGKSIDLTGATTSDIPMVSTYVQEAMIDLKKEIWAQYGGAKPTEEEFKSNPNALDEYKKWVDFIMRDVPEYYTVEDIMREVYAPSELTVESLEKIGYLKKR